ncbi:hypothetical protein UCMB321_3004 [Pseudomonas batumici]|uniref:Uncharacterized protein n=1 Tax=Pseudomonas batumici TaxID=226910 RepID=A0A0C2EWV7_9PSED|nr:hypothetical protein UCMB321_3004 [Pseudomonas batumici]
MPFWGMLHSVEVARAVVDALLEGAPPSHQVPSELDSQPID